MVAITAAATFFVVRHTRAVQRVYILSRLLHGIWNGKETGPARFNECVLVGGERWACSGTLISDGRVLTAAHCVTGCGGITKIFMGHDHQNHAEAGRVADVTAVYCAPGYDESTFRDDIAVAFLKVPARDASHVRIDFLSLAPPRDAIAIAGFGNTNRLDTFGAEVRREGTIHIRTCDANEAAQVGCFPDHEWLSVGYDAQDACGGDSGGPPYGTNGGVIGVVSRPPLAKPERCSYGTVFVQTAPFKSFLTAPAVFGKRCG